jgi:hypothetical protein
MGIRRVVGTVSAAALVVGGLGFLSAPVADAAGSHVCKGTPKAPGHLSGTTGPVIVRGACAVDAGAAHVHGDVTVTPGSVLVAAFGHNHSHLTVDGDVQVQSNGTAILGCLPSSFPCIDDSQKHPTLSSHATVGRNIIGNGALGMLVHNTTVGSDVIETGGGGGFNCNPQGIFNLFQSPVFSAFEDMTVAGNIRIRSVRSCWAGIARAHVTGDVIIRDDKYNDPDAMEIVSNLIQGNLSCEGVSRTWDSGDLSNNLFPRQPQPNTVHGKRSGQCVLNSPTSPKDPPGPGAF